MTAAVPMSSPAELADFDSLYDEHVDGVWRLLMRLGVPQSGLEDATQEVFLIAHRRRSTFRGDSTVKTWMGGIAVRVAKDVRRALARRGTAEALEHHPQLTGAVPLDERIAQRQVLAQVLALLDLLEHDHRVVLVFADFEGLTAPEIVAVTGLNLNTVYTRLRAARHRFNELVDRAGGIRD